MKSLVCIVCPNGCMLNVEGEGNNITVTGNRCKRGEAFAVSEMTNATRTICSTVRTVFPDVPVLPVRVSREIPKNRIFDVMREIANVRLDKRVGREAVIIENVLGLGADIISTSDILIRSARS